MACFDGTSPSGSIPNGGTLTIQFCKAGATSPVEITVDNGDGDTRTVVIDLDANGCGSASFDVPSNWSVVNLNHPGCAEWTAIVEPSAT